RDEIHQSDTTTKSTSKPNIHAIIKPEIIPNRIGIILRNPRIVTQKTIVINKVSNATSAGIGSITQSAPASSGAIHPAISAAVGTSSSPTTATIAPIAAGGKMTSIHLVPAILTINPTKVKTIPTIKNPPSA